ncbi:putative disease resistance protein [Nymphaea thermarum]|nr:putative disease resistance protein [Nymphaea thermarum]
MNELPNSIQCLTLLKYLNLRNSNVRRLPSSISKLCNLQTLDLSDSRIEELPKETGELCNLRYLRLERTTSLTFIAEGLGKLTNLRTLSKFLVCNDKEKTNGSNITELKDLNKLKGELLIEGLGRSRKAIDHIGNAQLLEEKHDIISLEFDFGTIGGDYEQSGDSEQSGLLEALEPPLGLEALEIRRYKGQIPAWHLKTEYTKLHSLKLERCHLWEKLISITSLKELNVIDCPALCEIASMPALEWLEVKNCGSLQQSIHDMPVLKSLEVEGCKRLKTLTNMLALESLEVRDCDSLEQLPHEMPALKLLKVYISNSMKALVNMLALESLEVRDCDSLEQLPHEMPALKSLKVYISNSMKALVNMPALESLEVKDCGRLEQVADMPALKSLDVEGCNMLKTITNMPALKRLRLSRLNTLKRLPSRLPSLEELRALELPNWEGWPAGETTFTSIPCLREAYFYNCPKMQIQGLIDELAGLQSLSVLKCRSARLEWKLLEQLPNLIRLTLDGTALESAQPSPLSSEESTFLPSLKTLELRDNTNVDELKWGRVPEWVWELSQLQELNLHCFSGDISLGGHCRCLPKLRYLRLFRFPNLKSLVDITTHQNENDSVATTCPMDANEQIASLSNLEKLEIWFCPALDLPQELRYHLGESSWDRDVNRLDVDWIYP